MEDAIRSHLIQRIKADLASCEADISALAHEALSPAATAWRRAEALILRAEMQSRSVSLSRQLQKLQSEAEALHCAYRAPEEPSGVQDSASPKNNGRSWQWTTNLFRAS